MRKLMFGLFSVAAMLPATAFAASPFGDQTGSMTFAVDAGRGECKFISDMTAEKITGTAKGLGGSFTVDPANPAGTSGKLTIPVARLESGNAMRDSHMRGPDWLNAPKQPELFFDISGVAGLAGEGNRAKGKASGKFGMAGQTKAIDVPVELAFAAEQKVLKVTTKFALLLSDFGIKGKAGTVGKTVSDKIAVECTVYAKAK